MVLFHLQAVMSQVDRMAGERALGSKGKEFDVAYFAARGHLRDLEVLLASSPR